jgi:hypothetical protein
MGIVFFLNELLLIGVIVIHDIGTNELVRLSVIGNVSFKGMSDFRIGRVFSFIYNLQFYPILRLIDSLHGIGDFPVFGYDVCTA